MTESRIVMHREDITEISGGKHYVYDWTSLSAGGDATRFFVDCSRIDTESSYTVEMNIAVQSSGASEPLRQRQVIFGHKGEVEGNIRHDRVFITRFLGDGTSRQQELPDVHVRLDLGHIAEMPFATLIGKGPEYLMDLMQERR